MKARVKATGEIVDVDLPYISLSNEIIYPEIGSARYCTQDELDFDIENENIIAYWTHLEHQYAGMAMQAMLTSPELMQVVTSAKELLTNEYAKRVAVVADRYAHALVEELKEKEE